MKQNTPNLKLAGQRAQKAKVIYQHLHDDQTIRHIGKQKTCYVRSYGCQSNLLDGETMIGILKLIGYRVVDDINQADLVILNACAVRENAEKKVYGEIGLLKRQFKLRKNFMLGVCGCMFQQENTVKKIIEHYPYVSFVFGTHNLYDLPYIIQEVDETKKQVIKVYSKEGDVIEGLPIDRTNKFKAFVNIMYGCDRFCSYCIVPYTRGKIRSRKKNDILNEIKQLIKDGYQEVTLLGQNVNSYGNDQNDDYHFVDLLNDICQLPIKRIRYTTSNPWNFDEAIVDLHCRYPNLMPYFHLPIQSGDETILAKMNRHMKISRYLALIRYIRQKIPNATISTDLIVGFPNETDEQFANTLKLYNEVQFDNAYTFIYSKRSGTPASTIVDTIPLNVKQQRLAELNNLVRKYAKKNNQKFLNQVVNVLVDGKSKTNADVYTGYSPEWKVVNFTGKTKPGKFVNVKITAISQFSLTGKIVK